MRSQSISHYIILILYQNRVEGACKELADWTWGRTTGQRHLSPSPDETKRDPGGPIEPAHEPQAKPERER